MKFEPKSFSKQNKITVAVRLTKAQINKIDILGRVLGANRETIIRKLVNERLHEIEMIIHPLIKGEK